MQAVCQGGFGHMCKILLGPNCRRSWTKNIGIAELIGLEAQQRLQAGKGARTLGRAAIRWHPTRATAPVARHVVSMCRGLVQHLSQDLD